MFGLVIGWTKRRAGISSNVSKIACEMDCIFPFSSTPHSQDLQINAVVTFSSAHAMYSYVYVALLNEAIASKQIKMRYDY